MKTLLHSQFANERGQQFDFLRCSVKWKWLGKCVAHKVSIKSLSSHHHQYGRRVSFRIKPANRLEPQRMHSV